MLQFDLLKTDPSSHARRGTLTLNHGAVQTPIFMPVGTYGTVKGVMPRSLHEMGAQIILGNTFHLWMRPGLDIMKGFGGLHQFEKWDKPILTDSGGFQVWSLGEMRKITEEGVHFASPVNGDKLFMSPEVSMQIQTILNSDIVMQLDECTPYETKGHITTEAEARKSMEMSRRWALRSKAEFERLQNPNALFGIVQGGMFPNLREESLAGLVDLKSLLRQLLKNDQTTTTDAHDLIRDALDDIESRQLMSADTLNGKEWVFSMMLPFSDAEPVALRFTKSRQPPGQEDKAPLVIHLHTRNRDLGEIWLQTKISNETDVDMVMWALREDVVAKAKSQAANLADELDSAGLRMTRLQVVHGPGPQEPLRWGPPETGSMVDVQT